ncbi:MAG: sigma-54-dependent Fis family transcriptional regulator, partial [Candidatus Hydrogenedentes bacterium]|nr:sigma-54-dependent Fis family transcriptional regulator [Candidatus Hydrogenedentota bacterium]
MEILVVDDDQALCRSLQLHLEHEGHQVTTVHTGTEGLGRITSGDFDVIFLDLNLPDAYGLDLLREARLIQDNALCIMITGMQDSKATIEAVRLGAFDYIRKPLDLDAVLLAVEKAQQRMKRRKEGTAAPFGVSTDRPHEIIGAHPAIIEVLKQIAMFGESRVPVLIQGESGTGKELVARALHDTSSPGRPFVAVNCSAVVSTLLESELFGHVKGAFTGADSDKAGKLEAAGDGSIFFDEIGDMAGDLQAKILRVLQEREFERVGSTKTLPFRARVLAATHRDLPAMIQQGQFREDLYYRLAVSTIHVPALRERRSDLPLLTERLLARLSSELHKP